MGRRPSHRRRAARQAVDVAARPADVVVVARRRRRRRRAELEELGPQRADLVGEAAVLPDWVDEYVTAGLDIDDDTLDWIKAADYLFYAFHWYSTPSDKNDAVTRVKDIAGQWNVALFSTESGKDCTYRDLLRNNSIPWTYWHYSNYCDTGADFGNKPLNETFGACILGWGSGNPGPVCSP